VTPDELRAWRRGRGWTLAQAAAALGWDETALSRWETGARGRAGPGGRVVPPEVARAVAREDRIAKLEAARAGG
jgi:transcriptional regulator with XRE-family HTH domain